ncbi:MAG: PAS domain S-box protein [Nitrospiraceae bacterium]|nr:MAG: PAS domain S-box protein [Nitrospiraceae bacterium]
MLIGIITGITLGPFFEKVGLDILWGIVVMLAIVLTYSLVKIVISRHRTIIRNPANPKADSEVGFVVDTFHDVVSKLKEKEAELEKLKASAEEKADRAEAYNENILQSVPSGVISLDNELRIRSINNSAENILGVRFGDAIGKQFNEVFLEPLSSVFNEQHPLARDEYQYVTVDNRHIWLGITSSELYNGEGSKIGYTLVFSDLTDIKSLQAQVELKHRLSQLGEMSAGISHELRNSMSVISGYAKLLGKKVNEINRSTVESIISEIGHMDQIISELLSFAKPSVLVKEDVELNSLIERTISSIARDKKDIPIALKADSPVTIKADGVLLRQALSNLLINAIEAISGQGRIDITLKELQNKAEVTIKDNGCGIPEDIRQKIFLPFFSTKQEGIGFGLALVQKIIVSHGGSIEVNGKEKKGTTFRIELPLS